MYWVHLLYVEALLIRSNTRIGRLLELGFYFHLELRMRYWNLDTRIFKTDTAACLKQNSKVRNKVEKNT